MLGAPSEGGYTFKRTGKEDFWHLKRVNPSAQVAYKPFTKQTIGPECDCPPGPAQLGIYDQIIL